MTQATRILLCGWVLAMQWTYGQPISTIDSINANPIDYADQGFFLKVSADSNLALNVWIISDSTGSILANFNDLPAPNTLSNYLVVGIGDYSGGVMQIDVNYYHDIWGSATVNYTNVQAIRANPVHEQGVILTGQLDDFLPGSWDNYLFDDHSGTIQVDFDLQMNAPDLWRPIELWGEVDYSNLGYLDVNVWAWYYLTFADVPEFDLKTMVYPNPAKDIVTIKTPGNVNGIQVVDMNGRLILNKRQNVKELEVTSWPDGYYFISLFDHDQKVGQSKLVVQH